MYDIVYISPTIDNKFNNLKKRFPLIKLAENLDDAKRSTFTSMIWLVYPDIVVMNDFNFDFIVPRWDEKYVHVFKNGHYYDGISLIPRMMQISNREFDNRFYINKKEIDIVASIPEKYDIVFISYNESNAEDKYNKIVMTYPTHNIHRIDGVSGIHNAHIAASKKASTSMFWVIDADADILDTFTFTYQVPKYEQTMVHVWKSINPVNDLEYGYGGVKLLPTILTMQVDINSTDMTTSISHKFKVVQEISNITAFNTDPFSAWRSAFRECVKLSSRVIYGQEKNETNYRLETWCTKGASRPHGTYAIAGANAGKEYGQNNAGNIPALFKINDFNWLSDLYESCRKLS